MKILLILILLLFYYYQPNRNLNSNNSEETIISKEQECKNINKYYLHEDTFNNKKEITNIFTSMIKKYRGHVLYINCWSVSCYLCRAEIPYIKKFIKIFKDKEIKFIFLCIDSDYKKWKNAIKELQIEGINYYYNKKESKELRWMLGISGFPYYLLVDKKGKIVKQGFDIRPKNERTRLEIEKLL